MKWTLVNCPGTFTCYLSAVTTARRHAKRLRAPILVIYHGPRNDKRSTKQVSFWIMQNGDPAFSKDDSGEYVHPPDAIGKI